MPDVVGEMLLPLAKCSMRFLMQVLKGVEKLLKQVEVRRNNVPRYPEFMVEKVYATLFETSCGAYLLDIVLKMKQPDRNFVFDMISTLEGQYLDIIVTAARKNCVKELHPKITRRSS